MLVYRVEKKGNRFEGRSKGTWEHQTDWYDLPNPGNDGICSRWDCMKHHVCATSSVDQFKLWWKDIRGLKKLPHVRVAVLDVPDSAVLVGRHQVVIDRSRARIVGTLTTRHTISLHKPLKFTKPN